MTSMAASMRVWYFRLRIASYVFGIAGALIMTFARGMEEPARTLWMQRAFICVGLMFCIFIVNYLIFILRLWRK